jgi:hypothetical protein
MTASFGPEPMLSRSNLIELVYPPLQFHKDSQLFIDMHDEMLSVAMRVHNRAVLNLTVEKFLAYVFRPSIEERSPATGAPAMPLAIALTEVNERAATRCSLPARSGHGGGRCRRRLRRQEKIIEAQPNYGLAWCVLGVIDAALRRKEEALSQGRRAVELLPVEKDSINGMHMIKYLAMTAAWVGEKDVAFEQLATAVLHPSDLSYGQLTLMPFWEPLRGDPRFEKIVASLAPKD